MEVREQSKEIEMPSSVGYNSPNGDSSSSKLTSPSLGLGDRSIRDQIGSDAINTIFNPPPQTLENHHPLPFQSHFQLLARKDDDQAHQNPDPVLPTPISTASGSDFKTPQQPPSTAANNKYNNNNKINYSAPCSSSVRYRECLKNHAASIGGHILDGCGEFMPSGDEASSDSLKCAACECHRNFHRKEVDGDSQLYAPNFSHYSTKDSGRRSSNLGTNIPPPHQIIIPPQPPFLHHHHHHHQQQQRFSHGVSTSHAAAAAGGRPMQPLMMAFGGRAAESSSEDLNMYRSDYGGGRQDSVVLLQQQPSASKKRFRTKFSQAQKAKMMEFAEKLGWKIQKHDGEEVQQFCSEVGVKRKAFKVWMHNNKQTVMKKKEV